MTPLKLPAIPETMGDAVTPHRVKISGSATEFPGFSRWSAIRQSGSARKPAPEPPPTHQESRLCCTIRLQTFSSNSPHSGRSRYLIESAWQSTMDTIALAMSVLARREGASPVRRKASEVMRYRLSLASASRTRFTAFSSCSPWQRSWSPSTSRSASLYSRRALA